MHFARPTELFIRTPASGIRSAIRACVRQGQAMSRAVDVESLNLQQLTYLMTAGGMALLGDIMAILFTPEWVDVAILVQWAIGAVLLVAPQLLRRLEMFMPWSPDEMSSSDLSCLRWLGGFLVLLVVASLAATLTGVNLQEVLSEQVRICEMLLPF